MSKVKLIVALSFLLAFAAGVCVGLVFRPPARSPRDPSWFAHELGLTAEQQKRIEAIWSEVVQTGRTRRADHRRAVEKAQDERIRALLTESQQAEYDGIMAELRQERDAFHLEGKAQIDKAVEDTKRLLSERQRMKYEKLLEEMKRARGPMPGPPPRWDSGKENRAHRNEGG